MKTRNEAIHLIDWDCIVIDGYHFGTWRDSARELYDPEDRALAEAPRIVSGPPGPRGPGTRRTGRPDRLAGDPERAVPRRR